MQEPLNTEHIKTLSNKNIQLSNRLLKWTTSLRKGKDT
jgi:hypothetical protein